MNDLENEFIPYEQALALKELGFDEPCFAIHSFIDNELNFMYVNSFHTNNDVNELSATAPLYQQAFKFFREKGYENYCPPTYDDKTGKKSYQYIIRWNGNIEALRDIQSYEEAEIACLNKLIEIVKRNTIHEN